MSELFASDFLFRNALVGGFAVSALCGVLGVYVVLRRLVLLGMALPQAGAAGIACAFWLTGHAHAQEDAHLVALAGSFAATLLALGLVLAGGRTRLPAEWRIGALLASASAATLLCVALDPTGDLEMTSLLRGELLAISDADLAVLLLFAAVAAGAFALYRREILLASFDPDFARTLGKQPERGDALLYLLLGTTIALGVMAAGPLVVFACLVLPALAALALAPGLGAAIALSGAIGGAVSLAGFALAYRFDLPAGPVDVLLAATVWITAAAAGRVRRRVAPAALAALALALGVALSGGACATGEAASETRTPFPELEPARPVAVLAIHNETGDPLRFTRGDVVAQLGGQRPPGANVPDALRRLLHDELARRGAPLLPLAAVDRAVTSAAANPAAAREAALRAELPGPVLWIRLSRWNVSQSGFLVAWLDLELCEPTSGDVLWRGATRAPVGVPNVQTPADVLAVAAPALLGEALGTP
jgi:ABC-type Mn2+/Zn2+ transport system permease subunit